MGPARFSMSALYTGHFGSHDHGGGTTWLVLAICPCSLDYIPLSRAHMADLEVVTSVCLCYINCVCAILIKRNDISGYSVRKIH